MSTARQAEEASRDEDGPNQKSILRSQTTASRMSGYDFAHPGGQPRHLRDFVNSHPTAGDLSLIEAERPHAEGTRSLTSSSHQQLEESTSGEEDSRSCEAASSNFPDSSSFAQQKIPHLQVEWNGCKVMAAACIVGIILLLLSLLTNHLGLASVEVSIQYNSSAAPGKSVRAACQDQSCRAEVVIPEDMPAPVQLMYNLYPFYQNYPNYIESGSRKGAWPQLTGKFLQGADLKKQCPVEATRIGKEGLLDPCGLQACSFFNDVFRLKKANGTDLSINQDYVAIPDDLARMKNPPGYPNIEGVQVDWLYMRYPEVISKAEGVKNQRFVDWMRPAALPSLLKSIGQLDAPLSQGETILLEIDSRFSATDLEKKLVMISPGALGGDSEVLSAFLFYAGIACLVIVLIVFCSEHLCKRPLGHPRFQRMRIACQESESSSSENSESDGTV